MRMEDPKREKMVQVHHKLEIGSGRATSRKRFLVTNVVAVAVVASIAVGVYADVTDVALILLLVDPIDDVLMAIP